eukprot:5779566-Alexandrium_andersonii.AAC.1
MAFPQTLREASQLSRRRQTPFCGQLSRRHRQVTDKSCRLWRGTAVAKKNSGPRVARSAACPEARNELLVARTCRVD